MKSGLYDTAARIDDFSLDTGFEGLLRYVIYHLQRAISQKTKLPFDNRYLSDLYDVCIQLNTKEGSEVLYLSLDVYKQFYLSGVIKNYNATLFDFVTVESDDLSEKITSYSLGLKDGDTRNDDMVNRFFISVLKK